MLAGIGTYAPCLPKGIWGQRAMWALVSVAGPRALPGKAVDWSPPLDPPEWAALTETLESAIGAFDAHTVYERRRGRAGLLMLLMRSGKPVGFMKARHNDPGEIDREVAALQSLEANPPTSFSVPRVLEAGSVGEWNFVLTTTMPAGMHRMINGAPAMSISRDISSGLADLARPEGTAEHWQPAHGDFTPWNLRVFRGDSKPWLIDWEEACWAPPGADALFYRASAFAIGRPTDDEPFPVDEAAAYWARRVRQRTADNRAAGLEMRPLDRGLEEAFAPALTD